MQIALLVISGGQEGTDKAHKHFQHKLCGPHPKNLTLGPRKKLTCLTSWERTQKRIHKNFPRISRVQKGVPNGPFWATKRYWFWAWFPGSSGTVMPWYHWPQTCDVRDRKFMHGTSFCYFREGCPAIWVWDILGVWRSSGSVSSSKWKVSRQRLPRRGRYCRRKKKDIYQEIGGGIHVSEILPWQRE